MKLRMEALEKTIVADIQLPKSFEEIRLHARLS